MLLVEAVSVRAGRRSLLDAVTLEVAPGEVLAVLGPNGSGKTTLLRVIAGLDAPSAGRVRFGDELLTDAARVIIPPERRGVGLLFQEGVLFPHLDVAKNVALGVPRGAAPGEVRDRVARALETTRITHLARTSAAKLSGGEQQRVALARALAQEPRVLLLDEPFHSLDDGTKDEILAELRAVVEAKMLATVLVTHVAGEAQALATRFVRLGAGRITEAGETSALSVWTPARGRAKAAAGEVRSS